MALIQQWSSRVFFAQSRSLLCVFVNKHTQDDTLDYECVLDIEGQSVVVEATVEPDATGSSYLITCEPHQVRKCLCVSQEWGRAPLSVYSSIYHFNMLNQINRQIEWRKRMSKFVASLFNWPQLEKWNTIYSSTTVNKLRHHFVTDSTKTFYWLANTPWPYMSLIGYYSLLLAVQLLSAWIESVCK